MVLVKNLKFCERFVLCKIHPEKVFGDVLVRKQAFLDKINMDLQIKGKLAFLQRGLSMILVKKLKFFHVLCLSIINKCVQKRKIRIFRKGLLHRFDQKFEISSTLIVMQNRLRKSIWERSS